MVLPESIILEGPKEVLVGAVQCRKKSKVYFVVADEVP